MEKVGIVILAGSEDHEGTARVVNALETAKELKENGDDVSLIFDGAGTTWIAELSNEEHGAHHLYNAVKSKIDGACSHCSASFGVREEVKQEVPLLDHYDNHPSLRNLIIEGYQIITF